MDTDKTYIVSNINNIFTDRDLLTSDEINEKYAQFKEKFPKLFEAALEYENKEEFLHELDNMLRIRSTRSTKTSEIATNVSIGEHFGRKYIYPLVGEPSQAQKTVALQKIIKEDEKNSKDLN